MICFETYEKVSDIYPCFFYCYEMRQSTFISDYVSNLMNSVVKFQVLRMY